MASKRLDYAKESDCPHWHYMPISISKGRIPNPFLPFRKMGSEPK